MKFLVIGKRNLVPMEPKMAVGLIQAAKEYQKAQLAAGVLDVSYMFADGSGGFVISNADSQEDALDRLMDFPMFVFLDWEVKPLVDSSHTYDKLSELFQKMSG